MKMIVTVPLVVLVAAIVMAFVAAAQLAAPAKATSEPLATATYKVEMTRINGDRSSVAGVQAADKVQVHPGNPCDDITVTVPADSADSVILAAADAKSSCPASTPARVTSTPTATCIISIAARGPTG